MENVLAELIGFAKYVLLAGAIVWLFLKLMEEYTTFRRNLEFQKMAAEREKSVLQLRLQACERLILFLDRVSLPNLIGRLRTQHSQTGDLSTFIMLNMQKELEHNVTQQLYVSAKLWEIINLIKDELSSAADLLGRTEEAPIAVEEYIHRLLQYHQSQGASLIEKGQKAVKEEISKIIG